MCSLKNCKLKNTTLIGNCNYCNKIFCIKHRYPESHNCENIEQVRSKIKLETKLIQSKINPLKITII